MGQSNVGIRINIDAGQAKGQVEDLSRTIADLNKQLKEAAEAKDWKSVAQLTQAVDSASSGRGQIMAQARQAESSLAKAQAQAIQAQTGGGFFGGGSDVGKYLIAQSLVKLTDTIVSALEKGFESAKKRASGDYTGAAVSEMQRDAGLISGGAGLAAGVAGLIFSGGNPFVAGIASQLTEKIVGYFSGKPVHEIQENLAYSAQYKNALPGIDTLNQLYGGAINRKDADKNNRYGMELRGRAAEAAKGTGLDTDDFIQALKQSGGYGINNETQAMNMLHTQALWGRFTGADLGTIQKFAGQAYRYGGETDATSVAYAGLKAQDMGKGQITEFMNSLERVMSESISKGFVKSTEEIAGNMALLYKLSGGSVLWQGEQGAQRYSQMSNAIANATNLQSVEDVISYGAARDLLESDDPAEREANFWRLTGNTGVEVTGDTEFRSSADGGDNVTGTVGQGEKVDILGREGDYYRVNRNGVEGYIHNSLLKTSGNVYTGGYSDEMQIIEGGLSSDLLKGQWAAVSQLDGDNAAAMIERFKTMYGLNYTGASQVWAMSQNSANWTEADWEKAEHDIKRFQVTPGYESDSNALQNILNDLRQKGIEIGQIEFFKTELPLLREAMTDLGNAYRNRESPGWPSQTMPALPAITEPIDMQPVMAANMPSNTDIFSREYWSQNTDYSLLSRYFLEHDRASRAFIDDTAADMGVPVNEILDYIVGGRNPDRFDAKFQNRLITSEVGHDTAAIDPVEYRDTMEDLVNSLHSFGASTNRLNTVLEVLAKDGIPLNINARVED